MSLEEAENYRRSMMYTKVAAASKPHEEVKTQGKAMFIKRNSMGMQTNSVKKEGIRPVTARTGTSGFSVRNISTRASSRKSQTRGMSGKGKRASSAMHSRGPTPSKRRCFSAGRTMRNMGNQSTAATDSRITLKSNFQNKHASSTQLIKPEDVEKLSAANKQLVK